MPCDLGGYHQKRPGSLHLVSWNTRSPYAPSLPLLEPSHRSVSSPSHMDRPYVSPPVNSPCWVKRPSHPIPGTGTWMKKPPENPSPQPSESPWLPESFLLSSQASWSRDKPSPRYLVWIPETTNILRWLLFYNMKLGVVCHTAMTTTALGCVLHVWEVGLYRFN